MKQLIITLLFFTSIAVHGQIPCHKLAQNFNSFSEANTKIKNAKFLFTDFASTNKSSWIKGARYYSCDKKVGYFLLMTEKKEYIFKNIPMNIWLGFKKAESHGKYYHAHIKGKYHFHTYVNIRHN